MRHWIRMWKWDLRPRPFTDLFAPTRDASINVGVQVGGANATLNPRHRGEWIKLPEAA